MTHEGRLIAGPGVWTGGAFEASRRLSCRRRCRRTTASPLAWARASSHAPARSTKSRLACDVRGDVAHPAVGGVEGHHAQGIQHQIHGAVRLLGLQMRQQCLLVAVAEARGVKLAGLAVENML